MADAGRRQQKTETLATLYVGKLRLERRNGAPEILLAPTSRENSSSEPRASRQAYSLRWRDCELITLNDKDKTHSNQSAGTPIDLTLSLTRGHQLP